MTYIQNEHDFPRRLNLAANHISRGRPASRTFNGWFEMNDGDAMVVALYRRARKNNTLRQNLWRYLARISVVETAFENRRRSTPDLKVWAEQMRARPDLPLKPE